ncbi:hypothetical protein F4778DRAFT_127984 [Xylariomycetidae sp. FL2044]|nr:hypothetical protein F4778DRAFT_788806 [Xylariomycetidae sp. FL2044]KAH9901841.1 hypothetical protein F4778DRAFT_127984 [Xylariomycetidae sp. FL2044]
MANNTASWGTPPPESIGTGPQSRVMGLKVHYTFDKDGQERCLARWPQALQIQAIPVDEQISIGVVDLRICLQAVAQCSPEITSDGARDFVVYAFDYSEPDTPLTGQGMLSWCTERPHGLPEYPPQMVIGRVTKNLLAIFGNGIKETLEVRLKLTAVAKNNQNNTAPHHNTNHERPPPPLQRSGSAMSENTEWKSLVQGNPGLSHTARGPGMGPSPAAPEPIRPFNSAYEVRHDIPPQRPQGPPQAPSSRPASRGPFPMEQRGSNASQAGVPLAAKPTPPPEEPGTTQAPVKISKPQSRPASRASCRAPTGRPRGRPRKKPAGNEGGSTSGYEEGTDADEAPRAKKRVKTTAVERNNSATFGSAPDSLRVAASTAGSLRNFRPIGTPGDAPGGDHLQEVPRAPTPVPVPELRMPGRANTRPVAPSALRRESSTGSGMEGSFESSHYYEANCSMSQALDARSPFATAPSPYSDEASPADISSSPPVPRSARYSVRSSPAPSSPLLPPLPMPMSQPDSGFMSGSLADSCVDETIDQALGEASKPEPAKEKPKPKPRARRKPAPKKQATKSSQAPTPPISSGTLQGPILPQNHQSKQGPSGHLGVPIYHHGLQIETVQPGPPELLPQTSIYKRPGYDRKKRSSAAAIAPSQPSPAPTARSEPAPTPMDVQINLPPPSPVEELAAGTIGPAPIETLQATFPPPMPVEVQYTELPTPVPVDGPRPTLPVPADRAVMGPSLPASTTVDASYSTLPLPTPGEEREPSLLPTPIEEQPDASFMHLSEFSPEELARFEAALMAETDREHQQCADSVDSGSQSFTSAGFGLVDAVAGAPTCSVEPPTGAAPTLYQEASAEPELPPVPASDPVISQLTFPVPASEPAHPQTDFPEEPVPNRTSKNWAKKQTIKQKLEQAIISGEMPQFCNNCGALETPTWRKIWKQDRKGVPEYHEYSEKPGHVTAIKVLSRDENDRPTAYEMIKKSLGPKDDKSQWNQVLLCNPCGIWFSKFRSHRPPEKWEKDQDRLNQPRRKRTGGGAPSRSKKARTKSDAQSNLTSEACAPTDPFGPLESSMSPKDATSNAFDRERFGDNISEKGSGKGRQRVKAVVECQGSTHSRGSGTPASPITLDDGLGGTRRVLFPSPRKDGEQRALGEVAVNIVQTPPDPNHPKSADKENTNVTDQTQKMDEDDFADLFGTPFRPSTPPPKSASSGAFKTPTRATPSHRPVTRSVTKSRRSERSITSPSQLLDLNVTPSRTPTARTPRSVLRSDRRSPRSLLPSSFLDEQSFESPLTRSINQLLSEADSFVMPPSPARFRGPAGSSGHPYHRRMARLQIDFDSLPNWDSDEIQRRLETQHYDFGNLLSTDGLLPNSPPALLKHYNTQQQHSGLPPPVFGIGTEANTLNANGVVYNNSNNNNLNGDGAAGNWGPLNTAASASAATGGDKHQQTKERGQGLR